MSEFSGWFNFVLLAAVPALVLTGIDGQNQSGKEILGRPTETVPEDTQSTEKDDFPKIALLESQDEFWTCKIAKFEIVRGSDLSNENLRSNFNELIMPQVIELGGLYGNPRLEAFKPFPIPESIISGMSLESRTLLLSS